MEKRGGGVTRRAVIGAGGLLVVGRALGVLPVNVGSPLLPAEAAATITLRNFLALSSLLTGVADLDPDVGNLYLESITANAGSRRALASLLQRGKFGSAGQVRTLEQLAGTGVFTDVAMRTVADGITENWFSGTYDTSHGRRVAAWIGALAWTTSHTKAMGLCGGAMGYWTTRPSSG